MNLNVTTDEDIFAPPNMVLGELLSEPTVSLLKKVEDHCRSSIKFKELPSGCDHYARAGIEASIPTVYLKCSKVNGFVDLLVNHELSHILIDIEGYPKLKCSSYDKIVHETARLMRSVIEHPMIQQRQSETGISDKDFQEMQVKKAINDTSLNDFYNQLYDRGLHERDGLRYVEFKLLCKNEELLKELDKTYDKYAPNAKALGKCLLHSYRKHGGSVKGKKTVIKILQEWIEILQLESKVWLLA